MNSRSILCNIIDSFELKNWIRFFQSKSNKFGISDVSLEHYEDSMFSKFLILGDFDFDKEVKKIVVVVCMVNKELGEKSSRRAQYEKSKKILKEQFIYDAGIFIYYDKFSNFRFSLVSEHHAGTKRVFSNFKRATYFVSKELTNKTFLRQIGDKSFNSFQDVKDAFSLAAVTDEFYREFSPRFDKVVGSIFSDKEENISEYARRDFALLWIIRIIFIGFIQKRKWIGSDEKFLANYWLEYKDNFFGSNTFYSKWLEPLFFTALNSDIGKKKAYFQHTECNFSLETKKKLQQAPFLNGGLFERKEIDQRNFQIPDKEIDEFLSFIFSYNWTIEENSLVDEELELNPEFLGIIFERLVNKANGAVYTPRVEVDFMCRISLVKWLHKNNSTRIELRDLYELFFIEGGKNSTQDEQRYGSFSIQQYKDILSLLETVTVCDPAVGSGAFPVGMLHVLGEIEQHVRVKLGEIECDLYERKKRIISNSLYGVEVREWAVWIAQLRLWITLFIDAPDELRYSQEAILPSLYFKMRQGDSLVQRIGKKLFPISGHANLSMALKGKVTKLKNLKNDFFQNQVKNRQDIFERELALFREIIEEEIAKKQELLERFKSHKSLIQDEMFETSAKQMELNLYSENGEKIASLESEIAELRAEKEAVNSSEYPFVWGIEFAEIFAEKGGFDIVIGNPPYVRQEDIEDPLAKIEDKKQYKTFLQEMVRADFPDYFYTGRDRKTLREKIDAKSDLYTYFYLRSLRLLNQNGLLTFICSNSWLDVGYGVWLQKFLLNLVNIHFIIDNHAKRSFAAADVNTIISLMDAPLKKIHLDSKIKFVAFKQNFEDVLFTENLLDIEASTQSVSNERFRVYPISIKELEEAATEHKEEKNREVVMGNYLGDKWGGKYLRAPDIFYTILEKGKRKLLRLGDIAEVRRGITTGANEFFYLTEDDVEKWKIEKEFLRAVLKSPKEVDTISIPTDSHKCWLFFCNRDLEMLKGTNALKYIKWGVKQGYCERPSCNGRSLWYSLGERVPAFMNFNYLINEVGRTYCGKIFVSDNFHEIYGEPYLAAFLNSTVFYLFQNIIGRVSFGGGLLKIQTYELKQMYCLPMKISDEYISHLQFHSIFTECGINPHSLTPISEQIPKPLADRAALDNLVFDELNLTNEERKEVYRAVCELVWNRISKAKSV